MRRAPILARRQNLSRRERLAQGGLESDVSAKLGLEEGDECGAAAQVVVGYAEHDEGFFSELVGKFFPHAGGLFPSMQKIRSARSTCPAVSLLRAGFSVPAERAS